MQYIELRSTCTRLNLEEGCFQTPLASRSPGINKLGVSPAHGLVAAAGEEGLLECYDLRQEQCAGRFDAASAAGAVRSLFLQSSSVISVSGPCKLHGAQLRERRH